MQHCSGTVLAAQSPRCGILWPYLLLEHAWFQLPPEEASASSLSLCLSLTDHSCVFTPHPNGPAEAQIHFAEIGVTPAALPGSNRSNPGPTATGDTGGAGGGCSWVGDMAWLCFSRTAPASTSLGQFQQLHVSSCWKALPSDLLIVKQHYALITKKTQAAKYVTGRDEG